ncbi:hypothetical protein K8R47_00870 [archaeon]|nr:hypothetical protein [archaeon]
MNKKRGQVSQEYLIIMGVVVIAFVIAAVLWSEFSSSSKDTVVAARAEKITEEIVKTAHSVYSQSPGTELTITIKVPTKVNSISFQGYDTGGEVVVNLTNDQDETYEIAKRSNVPLRGSGDLAPIGDDNYLVPGKYKVVLKNIVSDVCVFEEGGTCNTCAGIRVCNFRYVCSPNEVDSDGICHNDLLTDTCVDESGTGGQDCSDWDCS